MRFIGYFIGFVLALVAIPILTAAVCNASFAWSLTSESTYKEAFSSDSVFENLIPVTLPAILETANAQNLQTDMSLIDVVELNQVLTADNWKEISNRLIPSSWLKQTYNSIVDVLVGILNGDATVISTAIDIGTLRQNLQGAPAQAVADYMLSIAPECTRTQTDQIKTLASGGTGKLPVCKPNDTLLPKTKSIITSWLFAVGESFGSDSLVISDYITSDQAETLSLLAKIDRQILILLYLCPVALMALVVLVAVRSSKSFGRWIGITSLLGGFLIVITLIYMQIALLASFTSIFNIQNDIQRFVAQIASSLLRSTFSQASTFMLLQAGFFIILGFVLLVAVSFIRNNNALAVGETVLLTDDGQIISTATKRKP